MEPLKTGKADIVIGSRFLNNNGKNVPSYRKVGIQILTKLANTSLEQNITDSQSGFRAYNKKSLQEIIPSDNGMGIEDEIMNQIFIPFYTTKKNGSGIGLSLSRQIMRQHQGMLGVKTKMDEGTELALGLHASNNMFAAFLITTDWTVFQTDALFIDTSEPSLTWEMFLPVFVLYPLILLLFAKKYGWKNWLEKLTGKVVKPVNFEEIIAD